MSVRKSLPRSSNPGVGALKSLGIWALLAIGSFTVGLFILSPLINVTAGSRSNAGQAGGAGAQTSGAPPSSGEPPTPRSPASSLSVAPAKRVERRADSDVSITPEKTPAENRDGVQPPLGVEGTDSTASEARTNRRGRFTAEPRDDQSTTGDDKNSIRDDNDTSTRDNSRNPADGGRPLDSIDRSESMGRARATDPVDQPKPRRRRKPAADSGAGTEPTGPRGDVQKGDSIDR